MTKIYVIEFCEYTNYSNDTVYSEELHKYIGVVSPFLIREDEFEYYSKFGKGIRKMTLVGYIYDPVIKENK